MTVFALTILGNNSALPAHGRAPTAQVVTYHNRRYLVDCGEGTQMQMSRYKIRRSKIGHIFISHLHGDHYYGLPGLINSLSLTGRKAPLHVYAPPELEPILQLQLQCADTQLGYELLFTPLTAEGTGLLLDEGDLQVHYFSTQHRIPCFGFLFREIHRKRKIDPERILRYAIPVEYYKRLQQGEDYTAPDGTVIPNEQLTLPPPPGRSYAYCADTRYTESLIPQVSGCDLLYHETTYLEHEAEKAFRRYHSTTVQAATLAVRAGVKKLLVGHFSSQYESLDPFAEECRPVFPRTETALEGVSYIIPPPSYS
ncbi:ribonuclease Z [Compostibacter hankyongensis]|uniref:Ribonuclease Z n=1 Tax=Compostibacter hankyongensis TaxID=1007089 RepID=A0ABP8FXT3_9BACT